jgi:DNA-binding protein HU-beta
MQSIGKTELVRMVAEVSGEPAGVVQRVIETAMKAVSAQVNEGTAVQLKGFGTFKPQHRAARMGRNPKTGERMEIAESFRIGFTASKHRAE